MLFRFQTATCPLVLLSFRRADRSLAGRTGVNAAGQGERGKPRQAARIDNPAGGGENERTNRNASSKTRAQVAELADALDSGSSGRKVVEVRVLSWAPKFQTIYAVVGTRGRVCFWLGATGVLVEVPVGPLTLPSPSFSS